MILFILSSVSVKQIIKLLCSFLCCIDHQGPSHQGTGPHEPAHQRITPQPLGKGQGQMTEGHGHQTISKGWYFTNNKKIIKWLTSSMFYHGQMGWDSHKHVLYYDGLKHRRQSACISWPLSRQWLYVWQQWLQTGNVVCGPFHKWHLKSNPEYIGERQKQ